VALLARPGRWVRRHDRRQSEVGHKKIRQQRGRFVRLTQRTAGRCSLRDMTSATATTRLDATMPALTPKTIADETLGIITQAWSPIGGVNRYWDSGEDPLSHPLIVGLAEKYAKTPAQVILRWHLDRGVSVIPKSVNPKRIAENIDVFDFTLASKDVRAIDGLDQNKRGGPDPDAERPGRPAKPA